MQRQKTCLIQYAKTGKNTHTGRDLSHNNLGDEETEFF